MTHHNRSADRTTGLKFVLLIRVITAMPSARESRSCAGSDGSRAPSTLASVISRAAICARTLAWARRQLLTALNCCGRMVCTNDFPAWLRIAWCNFAAERGRPFNDARWRIVSSRRGEGAVADCDGILRLVE